MIQEFNDRAEAAVERYGHFLDILRSQADIAFRRGATDEGNRDEAFQTALSAARSYSTREHAEINDDTLTVAIAAHKRALTDLGAKQVAIPDRFADFIYSSAMYASRLLAAQAERDVMSMAQHIHTTALRVDLYVRTGRHTRSSAAAAVMLEDQHTPAFKFIDRAGRRFKSTKHIRDTYRMHMLHNYNEVYMDTVADHGHDSVFIDHPDPSFKWFGEEVAIVSGEHELPLYYDIKDEVFHPSSQATLTIKPQD